MKTVNIKSISAENNFAQMLEGFGVEPREEVTLILDDAMATVRVGGDYTELRFLRDGKWAASSVTIERPTYRYGGEVLHPATVNWSSSASGVEGVDYAITTVAVLRFAAGVADQLNEWAAAGELPRLNPAVQA